MAGIGFKLRQIFRQDTYLDTLRGIFYSSSLAGGPIFFSILCLILLGIFSSAFLSRQEMSIFLITVVYVFAFSLISTGLSQLVITRFLSDLIYSNRFDKILPTFTTVISVTIVVQLLIGLPFILVWGIAFEYKITALMLFVVIGCTWQLMIFLSAVKNFRIVLSAFMLGIVLSFLAAYSAGRLYGLSGFLQGYTLGQVTLFFVLLTRILVEFKSQEKPSYHIRGHFEKMPQLILVGFFYNLGIWVDKIIFWFSNEGVEIHEFLRAFADYDGATFVAFLTAIPSFTYFLVKVETDFYGHFRKFYESILEKETFNGIVENKRKIALSVRESLGGLMKIQGTTTVVCLLFSDEIAAAFRLNSLSTLILEKALLAVFLQMLLLTLMIFMMYFDVRAKLVVVASVFLAANVVCTLATLWMGYAFYGYGHLFACLIGLLLAYHYLNRHLEELEYHTFASQPIRA